MKIKELIKELEKHNPDMEVVLYIDAPSCVPIGITEVNSSKVLDKHWRDLKYLEEFEEGTPLPEGSRQVLTIEHW